MVIRPHDRGKFTNILRLYWLVEAGNHMNGNTNEDTGRYKVVVNHEEQYSIWFDQRNIPAGWQATGFQGTKGECLAHIEKVWTDMRPLSLRQKMAEIDRVQVDDEGE